MPTPTEVLTELDAYIAQHRYSRHPFVLNVQEGRYGRDALRRWAVQKYFQTREQNVVFSAIHSRSMPYLDIRRFQVEQLVDEETSDGEGSAPHFDLMRRFAEAMGATEEDFASDRIGAGVRRFVDYLHGHCAREHPVYGMLAIYVNESQTPGAADRLYAALAEQFGVDDHALEWFSVHGSADIEHSKRGRDLILEHARALDDFATRARQVVERGVEEWTHLQNFYVGVLEGTA